jgi:hypothetical protein
MRSFGQNHPLLDFGDWYSNLCNLNHYRCQR